MVPGGVLSQSPLTFEMPEKVIEGDYVLSMLTYSGRQYDATADGPIEHHRRAELVRRAEAARTAEVSPGYPPDGYVSFHGGR